MIKPFIDLALLAVFTLRATKPSGQINQTPARGVVKPTLCSIDFGSVFNIKICGIPLHLMLLPTWI
jgi:hypothetical protein